MRIPNWLYTPTSKASKKVKTPKRNPDCNGIDRSAAQGVETPRGIALIMVLILTTVLGAMAADLQNATSVNLQLAANARDRLQAHFHARSAVQLELFFLRYSAALNKGPIGQFLPISLADMSSYFVSSDTMKGLVTRGKTAEDDIVQIDGEEEKEFGNFQGSFWIEQVVDENRKINVGRPPNAGVGCQNPVHILIGGLIEEKRYDPLFERMGDVLGESSDPLRSRIALMGAITDFVDNDDFVDRVCAFTGERTTSGGLTEDSKYERLPYNARYKPKNQNMLSLAELRMVPGINDAFMRLFAENLTVWTDSPAVYLKDASDQMLLGALRALMNRPPQPGDEERFKRFLEERALMRILPPPLNKLSKPAFEQLLATAGIIVDPTRKRLLMDGNNALLRFDDPTAVYRITAVGRVGDTTSTMTVVWRDTHQGGQGDIFYWRED